jgi:hypothetical protein
MAINIVEKTNNCTNNNNNNGQQHLALINQIMKRIELLDDSRIDNDVITSNGFLYKHPYYNNKQIWFNKLEKNSTNIYNTNIKPNTNTNKKGNFKNIFKSK